MGVKLILLLGALAAVLYSVHILVKDYQALTASKVLKLLFKRETDGRDKPMPRVRWGQMLRYDPVQCARYLYCALGSQPGDNGLRRGLISMLDLAPAEADREAYETFKSAFILGRAKQALDVCTKEYHLCPFNFNVLLHIVQYLLKNN
ncbi:uncharacterized protein LOC121739705 [Aricia agestis]|uniref:uncharacterized protein LOC121739705 n=1 Tax=Aricia agestis TaxID=91739 RepID=UPI001C20B7B7|nr:uncharacterized protein LOC121739705 [Aricia agestis]